MSRTRHYLQLREKRTLTIISLVAVLLVAAPFQSAAQGKWTRKADMPTARAGATASSVDNKIYVFGGYSSSSVQNLLSNEVYDPQTNTWEAGLLPMPTPRSYSASAALKGIIYVLGGGFPDATAVNEAYTPATNLWDRMGFDLPWSRRAMSTAVVDSIIYVIGGSYNIRECYAYNPANSFSPWYPRTPMPEGGGAFISLAVYNGLVYAFGGSTYPPWAGVSYVGAYDPKTDQWTARKPMPTPRFGAQAYLVGDSIYVIGGCQAQYSSLATVEVYHPLTDTWEQRPPMPQAVTAHAGAVVNNKIYVIGGTSDWTTMLNQVWEYDPLVTAVGHALQVPEEFLLEQNYPNPFNPSTTISFQVPAACDVCLEVYDLLGREVAVLVNERKAPGSYSVTFDGANLSSGLYTYRLTAGEHVQTRKMVLMR